MLINPVTLTMSRHLLEAIHGAAKQHLQRSSPHTPKGRMLENAVDILRDELDREKRALERAHAEMKEYAKDHPVELVLGKTIMEHVPSDVEYVLNPPDKEAVRQMADLILSIDRQEDGKPLNIRVLKDRGQPVDEQVYRLDKSTFVHSLPPTTDTVVGMSESKEPYTGPLTVFRRGTPK